MNNTNNIKNSNEDYYDEDMPMKWYKFLIYFYLFASAVGSAVSGYLMLTGSSLDGYDAKSIKSIYDSYPALQAINIFVGITLCLIAIGCIYTRQKLKHFSKSGPTLFIALYGVDLFVTYLYLVVISGILGINMFTRIDGSLMKTIVESVFMIILNKIYFSKRAHLFVNP